MHCNILIFILRLLHIFLNFRPSLTRVEAYVPQESNKLSGDKTSSNSLDKSYQATSESVRDTTTL